MGRNEQGGTFEVLKPNLEHLYERYAQMQVCLVPEVQRAGHEQANGQYPPEEQLLRDPHVVRTVQQSRRASKDPRPDRLQTY